ncbi:hypothetical protein QBC44DRAFT_326275 [Cladorrhinum sp. PSN332]|nr:hypothetical protein QBC44DRAFT_326275 [Cladorrhinum sp. PSN332]
MNFGDVPTSASGSSDDKQLNINSLNSDTMEAPIYQAYPQHTFPLGAWDNVGNHHFGDDGNNSNNMWIDNLPMPTYDTATMYHPATNDNLWPTYAQFPAGGIDGPSPSTVHSSPSIPSIGVHGQGWPQPPEQPLPSPTSEMAPYSQYPFQYSAPSEDDFQTGGVYPTTDFATQPSRPAQAPPSTNTSSKPKNKGKGKAPTLKSTKKSDASSPKARGTKRKSPSPATSTSGAKTTPHIGIFPPNVDPKKASQKMQREAWEKAKNEAVVMSQRRLMLLDHERGALERETQKLQVNIGLMRETVARQHSELQEAISKADRLNRQY